MCVLKGRGYNQITNQSRHSFHTVVIDFRVFIEDKQLKMKRWRKKQDLVADLPFFDLFGSLNKEKNSNITFIMG